MPRPWQRLAACTAAALLTLLLCGCEVHGTVDVKSGTQAEANLIFTDAEVDCLGITKYAGLVIKGSPAADGNQTCRAQGTIDLDALSDFGIKLSQTGEYLMLDLAMPQQYGYMPTKIDITFPGTVVDGGGSAVSGTSIQLNELVEVANPRGTRVIARSHPGPEWWVMALAAGFGGGVAAHRGGPAPGAPPPAPHGDPSGGRRTVPHRRERSRNREDASHQPPGNARLGPPGTRPRGRLRSAVRPAETGRPLRARAATGQAPAAPSGHCPGRPRDLGPAGGSGRPID